MRTWLDLEERFRALLEPLQWARLECTWGAVPEKWRIVATGSRKSRHRIETLCGIGGRLLEKAVDSEAELDMALFAEPDPKIRWYRLLRSTCPEVRTESAGWRAHDAHKSKDSIYFATVDHLVEVCAKQCLELQMLCPMLEEKKKWRSRLYDRHGKELVLGAFATLLAAIITGALAWVLG
jgi:hypothetical protein